MQSIQTGQFFSLDSVKPLNRLLDYRKFCLEATQKACRKGSAPRTHSPVDGSLLESWHSIGSFEYRRCSASGSLFLVEMPGAESWEALLQEVYQYRNAPGIFHSDMVATRQESVFRPKLDWIQNTIRLQGLKTPYILEIASVPNPLTPLLKSCGSFKEVAVASELDLIVKKESYRGVDAAVLLESLDRSRDPIALLKSVVDILKPGGLLFTTSLVASGFDMQILGADNTYLYPPDRANCLTLKGLQKIFEDRRLQLIEISTPGVLDVEVVRAHLAQKPSIPLSYFERAVLEGEAKVHAAFQAFLQQSNMSSFARIVAKK